MGAKGEKFMAFLAAASSVTALISRKGLLLEILNYHYAFKVN